MAILERFDCASIELTRGQGSIVAAPKRDFSFEVALHCERDECMVCAARWHAHYEDPEQAAWCFYWLLTPFYRVVHELKDGVVAAMWIERWEAKGWAAMEPLYFMNPAHERDWLPAPGHSYARRHMQQDALPSIQPYRQIVPGAELDAHGLPVDSHIGVKLVPVQELMGHTLLE